jgi:eukaryotic-like serine/threonine-protein kinase
MPPTPGTRLGPYEILAPLGAGGMGEVYRARDPRLGREVALKILPPAFAYDPARRARFEQEARAAAALNHPNIVDVHDLGEVEGAFYLVSELVPGETLDALMERGPLPVKKLLDIAVQVADGMAAAHAARITHRDLKPPNIMVTPEGRVKILDFGLAKQAPAFPAPGSNADATVTVHQTEAGMILGTVSYMSPEQARGTPADYRSDQFSFGLILYEMAAGQRAFDKPATVQTMAAILSEDPPPIQRDIPAPLRWTIERCLAKEPGDRYESTRDLFYELRRLRDYLSQASSVATVALAPPAASKAARRSRRWLVEAILASAGIIAAAALGRYLAKPAMPDQSAYRFTPFAFDPGGQSTGIWSPDGKAVAYAGDVLTSHPNQVFVRYLDSATPIQITHLNDQADPVAWAPDARRIIFLRGGKPGGLWSVSVAGGEPQPFLTGDVSNPVAVSPDSKSVAIFRRGDDHRYSIFISSPVGAPFKRYEPDPLASHALYNNRILRFSPDGRKLLVLFRGDRARDEAWLLPYPAGKPRQVLTGKTFYGGTPMFSWMPDSRHVAMSFASSANSPAQIWLADTESENWRSLTSGTTGHYFLDVSPDGRKIVFTEYGGNYDIASVNLETGKARRVMATERDEYMPAWAAKQQRMVFVTTRNGPQEIWLQGNAGKGRPLVTARDFPPGTTEWFMSPDLSPDGERLMFTRMELTGGIHNWISNVSGGAPVPLTNDANSSEFAASWSPDGEYAVYLALHNGKADLMKVQTTGEAAPVVVKADLQDNVDVPVWSPAGDWIVCGNALYSPDGQKTKALGDHGTPTYVFSKDGKLLYGIRRDGDKELLFSLDVARGAEKVMGDLGTEFHPALTFNPAMRFSLAPDGKTFVYSVGSTHSNLWMFEGFQ